MSFKTISTLLVGAMLTGFIGCGKCDDSAKTLDLKWKSLTDSQLVSHSNRLAALENREPNARSVTPTVKSMVTNAAFIQTSGDSIDDALDNPPEALQEPSEPRPEPAPVVEPRKEVQEVSRPKGPVTYGMPRTSGYREKTTYKTVRRVVEEQVPVKIKVPVQKRDVYETITESYEVPVTRDVCVTETRQRTKTVMVPQTVVEDYTVRVPKRVTEMVTRTRSRQVKVGEEEVETPTAAPQAILQYDEPEMTFQARAPEPTYMQAAPTYVQSAPAYVQAPTMTAFQAAPTFAAPAVEVSVGRPTFATRIQNRAAGIELTRALNAPVVASPAMVVPAAVASPGLVGCADGSCQLNYSQTARPVINTGTARPTASSRIRTMFPRLGGRK